MLKTILILLVATCWASYAIGKDTKPVGKSTHIVIHLCFATLLAFVQSFQWR
jgi:hypothetical protein